MNADVSTAIDTPRFVLALGADRCAVGLRPCEMAPSGSSIRSIAMTSADSWR